MEEKPRSVNLAMTAALVGALFTLLLTIIRLDLDAEDFMKQIGFCLLLMIIFIAIAGSLNTNGQWSWRFLIFMQVLCAAVSIVAYLYEAVDLPFCITLVILIGLMIMFTTTNETKRWVEADRI